MNIEDTLEPTSDQLDAVELLGGPRIFTIEKVARNNAEQPINVHLAGFPRPWRPGKSMRRVLAACWGTDASQWVGRRVELYCDPAVRFGSEAVGGTRIRALSHIDGPKKIPLLVTRGKSATYTVQPLAADAAPTPTHDWPAELAQITSVDRLRDMYREQPGHPDVQALITARVQELQQQPTEPGDVEGGAPDTTPPAEDGQGVAPSPTPDPVPLRRATSARIVHEFARCGVDAASVDAYLPALGVPRDHLADLTQAEGEELLAAVGGLDRDRLAELVADSQGGAR